MVSATWDVLWTWRAPKISWAELLPWQRVNHFPQARHLTRKDLLKKHLQRQRQLSERLAESFDIMPLTSGSRSGIITRCAANEGSQNVMRNRESTGRAGGERQEMLRVVGGGGS
jgi:hypothetical protein